MKTDKLLLTMLIVSACCLGACRKSVQPTSGSEIKQDTIAIMSEEERINQCISQYLESEIAKSYTLGEFCIPTISIINLDKQKGRDSIFILGDFWVYNYNLSDDTLKMVSGGNHAGEMQLRQAENGGYKVVNFKQVGDGSRFIPTAKKIFGSHYDAYMSESAKKYKRDSLRLQTTKEYVKHHKIPATMFQDFGWPPVKL